MADGMKDIIKRLEQQRVAIERALSALREVDGTLEQTNTSASASAVKTPATKKRGRRRGGMTAEGRKRLSDALRARWAAKRANQTAAPAASRKATSKRGRKKAA